MWEENYIQMWKQNYTLLQFAFFMLILGILLAFVEIYRRYKDGFYDSYYGPKIGIGVLIILFFCALMGIIRIEEHKNDLHNDPDITNFIEYENKDVNEIENKDANEIIELITIKDGYEYFDYEREDACITLYFKSIEEDFDSWERGTDFIEIKSNEIVISNGEKIKFEENEKYLDYKKITINDNVIGLKINFF